MTFPHLHTVVRVLFLIPVLLTPLSAAHAEPAPVPEWLQSHFENMVEGRWVADNGAYRTDEEPFEAYATEWEWGAGRGSIRGHLVGVRDGIDSGMFWEYRVFWIPSTGTARVLQFGWNGAHAEGELRLVENDEEGRHTEMIQTFVGADGDTWRGKHVAVETRETMTTTSFREVGGRWEEQRRYTWHRTR